MIALFLSALATPALARDRLQPRNTNVEDRYWAQFRDGSVVVGKDLRDWHDVRRNPSLKGHALFDPKNPLRLLIDTTTETQRRGPYVAFANGDVLPGRVIGAASADPQRGLPAHLLVSLRAPLGTYKQTAGELAVRPEQIARVVLTRDVRSDRGPDTRLEPGTVWYADGRKVKVTAIRWAVGGIRALTSEGTFAAAWDELREIHPPGIDTNTLLNAALDDVTAPCPDPNSLVGRIVTEDGGVFTYRRAMLQIAGRAKVGLTHFVQPAWALEVIGVPIDHIATRSYRLPNEMPLSQLPAQTLAERSFTGFTWPWRRNASVRGQRLTSQELISDLGVGTHAYSQVAFTLPSGAKRFTSLVGLDRAVGAGGCAKCAVYRDKAAGKPLWQSKFLRGGDPPVRIGPVNVDKAKRLILVTDFGHEGRPRGADPLDIRDEADWLNPVIEVDRNQLPDSTRSLADMVPALNGWRVPDDQLKQIDLLPYWNEKNGRWTIAVFRKTSGQVSPDDVLFELTRKVVVTPSTAWLEIDAATDEAGREGHLVDVFVDGKPHGSIMNGPVQTGIRQTASSRKWTLGDFAGKVVTLTVKVHPRSPGNYQPPGIIWEQVQLGPIINNLPASGNPIQPDVLLTSLKPTNLKLKKKDDKLERGKLPNGDPLHIRGYPFDEGFGLEAKSEVTYALDPAWSRFVAVIGLADGTGIGPIEILLDGKPHWTTGDGKRKAGVFTRHDPAQQIDLPIDPGHKTITLRTKGSGNASAGWAYAGFKKR